MPSSGSQFVGVLATATRESRCHGSICGWWLIRDTDPGFCNTNLNIIHISVDMDKEENQNPQSELEPNEFIECFSVPLKDLYGECRKLEQQGFAIDARVGTLAEGIEIARRWKLWGNGEYDGLFWYFIKKLGEYKLRNVTECWLDTFSILEPSPLSRAIGRLIVFGSARRQSKWVAQSCVTWGSPLKHHPTNKH